MVTSLLDHERIETTIAKAKEIRGVADKMITLGKDGTLSARRQALAYLMKKETVSKLFKDIAPRMRDHKGGYTRIIKTRVRQGDAAPMAVVELTKLELVKITKEIKPTPSPEK